MSIRPLSPKQQRFVDEYLVDLNASQAAIRAGYSARNADKIGWQLLGKTRVADAIALAKDARSRRTTITQDAVLYEIALLQHSSVDHYHIDDYGNVTLAPQAPPDAIRAVASLKKKIVHMESGVSYETEIRLWNKPASLRMGGEHLGLFRKGDGIEELGKGLAALLSFAKGPPDAESS